MNTNLKNGSIMIGLLRNAQGDQFVAADTNGMAGNPFATWAVGQVNNGVGDDEATYWGHYFDHEADAMNDLIKRAGFKEAA